MQICCARQQEKSDSLAASTRAEITPLMLTAKVHAPHYFRVFKCVTIFHRLLKKLDGICVCDSLEGRACHMFQSVYHVLVYPANHSQPVGLVYTEHIRAEQRNEQHKKARTVHKRITCLKGKCMQTFNVSSIQWSSEGLWRQKAMPTAYPLCTTFHFIKQFD
jgi:hypothetical protein